MRPAAASTAHRRRRTDRPAELTADDRLIALEVNGDEDTAIRAAFDLSYNTLDQAVQRLFRLLGQAPGPDVTAEAAAALIGASTTQATRLLAVLVRGHLITEHRPGRYAFHDLLRAYAVDRAHHTDVRAEREAATGRLLNWYLHTTVAAGQVLYPRKLSLPVPPVGAEPATAFPAGLRSQSDRRGGRGQIIAGLSNFYPVSIGCGPMVSGSGIGTSRRWEASMCQLEQRRKDPGLTRRRWAAVRPPVIGRPRRPTPPTEP